VPALATEQYPQGLGPTTPEIARRLRSDRPAKLAFSACGAPGALGWVRASGRRNVVVVGMEAHVCVLHTVLDLLGEGFAAFVPVDAVSSRWTQDRDVALRRMERAGAVLTTAEATAFEWMGGADHPQFKAVSGLVKARAAARS
jgi:nicotinamidase-related amidase